MACCSQTSVCSLIPARVSCFDQYQDSEPSEFAGHPPLSAADEPYFNSDSSLDSDSLSDSDPDFDWAYVDASIPLIGIVRDYLRNTFAPYNFSCLQTVTPDWISQLVAYGTTEHIWPTMEYDDKLDTWKFVERHIYLLPRDDILFTALLYLRRLVHIYGPTLGPLTRLLETSAKAVPLIFSGLLHLAWAIVDDRSEVDVPARAWMLYFEPILSMEEDMEHFFNIRKVLSRLLWWDLYVTPEQLTEFQDALVASSQGRPWTPPRFTRKCRFYAQTGLAGDGTEYECGCRLMGPSSRNEGQVGHHAMLEPDGWGRSRMAHLDHRGKGTGHVITENRRVERTCY